MIDVDVIDNASQAIAVGSKSFAAAARLFDAPTRESAVMLYAWCRHCDDVIDGQQLGHGQRAGNRSNGLAKLAELERATRQACAGEASSDPVFCGLAEVVRRHQIPMTYPLEHLAGFRMDVEDVVYHNLNDTLLRLRRKAHAMQSPMAVTVVTSHHIIGTNGLVNAAPDT